MRKKWSEKLLAYVAQVEANDSKSKQTKLKNKKSSDSDAEDKKNKKKGKKKGTNSKADKESEKPKKERSDPTSTDRVNTFKKTIIFICKLSVSIEDPIASCMDC